jgi:putative acetyltransferase
VDIRIDDLQGNAIQDLLQVHLDAMFEHSPAESVHALDLAALLHPSITFWTAWDNNALLGCGALKQLSADHAELKSMRTASAHVRKGVARAILRHIESAARAKGLQRISLETGPHAPFVAAQKLYASEGFVECEPFADYVLDPYSLFMTKELMMSQRCYDSLDGHHRGDVLKQTAVFSKLTP